MPKEVMPSAICNSKSETVVSKELAPVLVAFWLGWHDVVCFKQYKAFTTRHSGSLINFGSNLANRNKQDMMFFLLSVLNFFGGHTLYKCIDLKLSGNKICAAMAPFVLGFHAMSDRFRSVFPDSRYHMFLLAAANGIINGVSLDKFKCITYVYTGHLQKFSTEVSELLVKGGSASQWIKVLTSKTVAMLSSFTCGCFASQAAANSSIALFSGRHKFGIIGAFYAAILALSDLTLRAPKKEVEEVELAKTEKV
jgi:hypothetical protein